MPMGQPSSFKQLPYDCQFITPPLICSCSTQIIRMLIVVLPKSQFVRSIAKTHGLPPSPSNSTTTRGCRIAGARRQAMGFGDRSDELGFWQDHDQHPDDLCAAGTYERRSNELTIIWKLFER